MLRGKLPNSRCVLQRRICRPSEGSHAWRLANLRTEGRVKSAAKSCRRCILGGPLFTIYKWGLRGPINGLINKWPPGLISRLLIKATTPFISGDGAHLVPIKDQSKYKVGIQTFHGNPWIWVTLIDKCLDLHGHRTIMFIFCAPGIAKNTMVELVFCRGLGTYHCTLRNGA